MNFEVENAIPLKVYDLSIDCIETRRKQAKQFTSIGRTANYLGVVPTTVAKYIGRDLKTGKSKRLFSPKHNKSFVIHKIHNST